MIRRRNSSVAVMFVLLAACTSSDEIDRVVGELASDRIELTAEFAEPIVEIAVEEGQTVAAGDVLVRQNDARAAARLAEAEAALDQARARLAELVRGPRAEQIAAARAALDGADKEHVFRNADYERIKDVFGRGLVSPDTLDRARVAFDTAAANLEQRRAELQELLAGTTIEELAQAESAVAQSEARRDAARIDLDRLVTRAPVAGVIDSRVLEPGERPMPGQVVLVLLAGDQAYARVYIPEELRVHISAGTPARILVDGLDEALDGRVRWVAAEAAFTPYYALTERDRGRLTFAAKVDFVDERERLPDGVPVEVEFPDLRASQ